MLKVVKKRKEGTVYTRCLLYRGHFPHNLNFNLGFRFAQHGEIIFPRYFSVAHAALGPGVLKCVKALAIAKKAGVVNENILAFFVLRYGAVAGTKYAVCRGK